MHSSLIPRRTFFSLFYSTPYSNRASFEMVWPSQTLKTFGALMSHLGGGEILSFNQIISSLVGQLSCARIHCAYLDSWSHNWLTVEKLIQFDQSVLTYKIVNRQCPESLWDKYHHKTQHSSYRTRNCGDLQIPKNKHSHQHQRASYTQ